MIAQRLRASELRAIGADIAEALAKRASVVDSADDALVLPGTAGG
jgi:hypothetical protein